MYDHLRLFGLLMHVGANGKRSKTEAMFCPAKTDTYSAGDTSDLLLDCGGTVELELELILSQMAQKPMLRG